MIALIYSQCGSCPAAHELPQDPFVQFGTTQETINEKTALVQKHLGLAEESISSLAKPNQTGHTTDPGFNRFCQNIQEQIHALHNHPLINSRCCCIEGRIDVPDAKKLNLKLTGDFLRYASQELVSFVPPAAQGPLSTIGARQIIKELISIREQLQKILDENFSFAQ